MAKLLISLTIFCAFCKENTMKYAKQLITVPAFVQGKRDGVIEIPVIAALGTGLALYREYGANGYQIISVSTGISLVAGMEAPTRHIACYWLEEVLIAIPIDWNGSSQQLHQHVHTAFLSEQAYREAIETAYKKACERCRNEEDAEEQDENHAVEQEKKIQALTFALQRTKKALQEAKRTLDGALGELEEA
jgi:hypothetical protein